MEFTAGKRRFKVRYDRQAVVEKYISNWNAVTSRVLQVRC